MLCWKKRSLGLFSKHLWSTHWRPRSEEIEVPLPSGAVSVQSHLPPWQAWTTVRLTPWNCPSLRCRPEGWVGKRLCGEGRAEAERP